MCLCLSVSKSKDGRNKHTHSKEDNRVGWPIEAAREGVDFALKYKGNNNTFVVFIQRLFAVCYFDSMK